MILVLKNDIQEHYYTVYVHLFPNGKNYEEAIDTKNANNYDIEIISIDTFDDVINYLENKKNFIEL